MQLRVVDIRGQFCVLVDTRGLPKSFTCMHVYLVQTYLAIVDEALLPAIVTLLKVIMLELLYFPFLSSNVSKNLQ